jgi:hypothetical protein
VKAARTASQGVGRSHQTTTALARGFRAISRKTLASTMEILMSLYSTLMLGGGETFSTTFLDDDSVSMKIELKKLLGNSWIFVTSFCCTR